MMRGLRQRTVQVATVVLAFALHAAAPADAFDQHAENGGKLGASAFEALVLGTRMYKSGDMDAAVRALEMAAAGGEPLALWKLGRMYADGDGVEEDAHKAFDIFQRLANDHADDHPRGRYSRAISNAFVALGSYYLAGIPDVVQPDIGQAIRLFRHAAMYFADSEAQYRLARLYLDGDQLKSRPRTAARWLNLAAEKGHVEAQAILGHLMWRGENVPRRPAYGLGWLRIAHEGASTYQRDWIKPLVDEALLTASETTIGRSTLILENWREKHGKVAEAAADASG